VSPEQTRVEVGGRELSISNLDKELFPAAGFTKGQLIDYYMRIAPAMLPHLADRPLTLKRYPNGVEQKYFFEKHVPSHAPDWIRTARVTSTSGSGEIIEYVVVDDLPSLVWAANLATIEFHVPLWRIGRHRKLPAPPDLMVFDLDPGEGTDVVQCCRVAELIHARLRDRGFEAFAKTSGSKGLQVYVALSGRTTWDGVREDAHGLARELESAHPDAVVSNMRKELRRGRVLIDWSQNHPIKTTVAVYSVRGVAGATVSAPVTWKEVRQCAKAGDPTLLRFTTDQVLAREKQGRAPFVPMG
jgi:bifunctional non-homologous end joining protein LigD